MTQIAIERPITVFYHVWQKHDWALLYQQQMMTLRNSGLYDAAQQIYVCKDKDIPLPFEWPKTTVLQNDYEWSESNTLHKLWYFCDCVPEDHHILYFHTKGLNWRQSPVALPVDAWRLYLEHYNLHRWRENIDLLAQYDTVGTSWTPTSHTYINLDKHLPLQTNRGFYAGNFWWANSHWIRHLDPDYLYEWDAAHRIEGYDVESDPDFDPNLKGNILRFNSELWLGTRPAKSFSWRSPLIHMYEVNCLGLWDEIL